MCASTGSASGTSRPSVWALGSSGTHGPSTAGYTAGHAPSCVAGPAAGPVAGACTPVNVAAGPATVCDYHQTVTRAVGVAPVWDDAPAWTGRVLADRARGWGWAPAVGLAEALD